MYKSFVMIVYFEIYICSCLFLFDCCGKTFDSKTNFSVSDWVLSDEIKHLKNLCLSLFLTRFWNNFANCQIKSLFMNFWFHNFETEDLWSFYFLLCVCWSVYFILIRTFCLLFGLYFVIVCFLLLSLYFCSSWFCSWFCTV